MFQGVEGYFALNGVSGAGQIPTINDVTTSTQVSFRAPNYLGRITFFGTDLAVGSTATPSGQQLPVFTGGTITGIEFEYNYILSRALEQGISDPSLYLPSLLEPSAELQLPNVSAAALSNAVVQSYQARSGQPLIDFLSQDTANFAGTESVNLIGGFNANDLLRGLGGNDILQGNGGDDTLDGGPGTDGLFGGEGNDLYLPGPRDPNTPTGDSVSDNGLTPGQIDTISYANSPQGLVIDLNPQDGNQSTGWAAGLFAGGIEAVIGSNFNDTIVGTDVPESIQDTAADTLFGGLGDDVLFGLGGSDLLQGGPGFDTLVGGADGDLVNQGPGDRAGFSAASNRIDLFRLADGSILVAAPGGGVDLLREIEFLSLTDGVVPIANLPNSQRNLVIGTDPGEGLAGSAGADLMFGRAGNDTLDGGTGDDDMDGETGNDVLRGGGGNDTMRGGPGDDTFDGGGGEDLAVLGIGSGAVTVFELGGGLELRGEGRDTIRESVERIAFSDRTLTYDQLREMAAPATITGTDAGETLDGTSSSEVIRALGGNDVIRPGTGSDTIEGGTGNDMIDFSGQPLVSGWSAGEIMLDLDLAQGRADVFGPDLHQFTGIENATGTDWDDRLVGNGSANRLIGRAGDDVMDGGEGADTINGGAGDDSLTGGPADADQRDVIFAGTGDDRADGGAGNDQLFGQEGNDTLAGGIGADELQGQQGNDVITGGALSDLVYGGDGDDFVNGGFGYDRINGGAGADRFFHLGVADHGSDWVQDYASAEGDVLLFGNAAATGAQFQVNFAHTATPDGERSGDDSVQEAFVIYRATGQIMWALVDGAGQDEITLRIGGQDYDLLA